MLRYLLYIAVILLILLTGLRYVEKRSIYFPAKDIQLDPSFIGLPYEEVFFDAPGGMLCGWLVPSKNKDSHILLFCHGNAGNVSHRLEKIQIFSGLGAGVFIFDYRGYGRSAGRPSENGLYEDAGAAYDYLISRGCPEEKIIAYGESIGGAVVVDLASRQKVSAIITEGAFSSAKDMIRLSYPFLPYFIFAARFDSLSKIKALAIPKLVIHSVDDEIVPYHLGERLFGAACPPKEFLKLRGVHNTAFLDSEKEYKAGIKGFIGNL